MKNIKISAWAVWNHEGTFDVCPNRKMAYVRKKEMEEFDIDCLKVSKCKIIIENEKR